MLNLILKASPQNIVFSVLGAIAGILIILVIYAVIMYAYFSLRKKHPSTRFRIEILFLGVAIVASAVLKFIIIAIVEGDNSRIEASGFWDYLCYCLSAIYGTVGGLQFEGLSYGIGDIQSNIWGVLYFGSSVMAGLVVLSIITAKASYELFSSIAYIIPYRLFSKKRHNVFVFTALTEDTLMLAKSIAEHYDEETRKNHEELKKYKIGSEKYYELKQKLKENKCLIIFSGENIPAFTRSNPLCREVMSNSYMYYSTVNGRDIKNCIIDRFGFSHSNVRIISGKGTSGRLCEFHFGLDEKLKPTEEDNNAFAIKEIERTLLKMERNVDKFLFNPKDFKKIAEAYNKKENEEFAFLVSSYAKKAKLTIIEHYVLTLSYINYQHYEYQRNALIDNSWNNTRWSNEEQYTPILDEILLETKVTFINNDEKNKFYAKIVKIMKNVFSACIQIIPVNESLLASKTLIVNHETALRKQIDVVKRSTDSERIKRIEGINSVWQALDSSTDKNDQEHIFKALILGFGSTGQFALNEIYKHFVYIDNNGIANQLYADVYDEGISSVDGIFASNHKLYLCADKNTLNKDESYPADMSYSNIYDLFGDVPRKEYNKYVEETDNPPSEEEQKKIASWWNKGMRLPKITFHNKSCNGLSFINELDLKTGSELDPGKSAEAGLHAGGTLKTGYNIIVIAFGSDRANITTANAIIDEIKREYYNTPCKTRVKQYIAVNIREEGNASKINWREEDLKRESNDFLNVFTFGTSEDIYSYKMILDYSEAMKPNSSYLATSKVMSDIRISDEQKEVIKKAEIKKKLSLEFNAIMYNLLVTLYNKKEGDVNFKNSLSSNAEIKNIIKNGNAVTIIEDEFRMRLVKKAVLKILPFAFYEGNMDEEKLSAEAYLSWLNNSPFIKESNAGVMDFRNFLNSIVRENFEKANEFSSERLLRLEHERWNRFHIANGWTYSTERVRDVRYHNCIAPFDHIPNKGSYANDYQNIASASKGLSSEKITID